jgi:hypothetical protein
MDVVFARYEVIKMIIHDLHESKMMNHLRKTNHYESIIILSE